MRAYRPSGSAFGDVSPAVPQVVGHHAADQPMSAFDGGLNRWMQHDGSCDRQRPTRRGRWRRSAFGKARLQRQPSPTSERRGGFGIRCTAVLYGSSITLDVDPVAPFDVSNELIDCQLNSPQNVQIVLFFQRPIDCQVVDHTMPVLNDFCYTIL